ncbi:MAG TPA: lectin-like protein, partial [Polyangiaceae bacterium]|nr:lectin-like protein [Polyangiaceae bacterium]
KTHAELGRGGSPGSGGQVGAGTGNTTSTSGTTGDGGVGGTSVGKGGSGSTTGSAGGSDSGDAGTPSVSEGGGGGEPVLDCSTTLYPDADGDGYGDDSQPGVPCETAGYAPPGDCDDDDFFVNPGLAELCDGIDNDCDPGTVETTAEHCPLNCLWDRPNDDNLHMFCWYPTQTWANASEICESQLMRLVRIDGAAEQAYVLSWHDPDNSWLGGSDADDEGTWTWQDGDVFWDGSSEQYVDWASGEPSNNGGEHCLILNGADAPDDGWWNDNGCASTRPFTCERY